MSLEAVTISSLGPQGPCEERQSSEAARDHGEDWRRGDWEDLRHMEMFLGWNS